jgi:hypothetical protein
VDTNPHIDTKDEESQHQHPAAPSNQFSKKGGIEMSWRNISRITRTITVTELEQPRKITGQKQVRRYLGKAQTRTPHGKPGYLPSQPNQNLKAGQQNKQLKA